MLEFMGRLLGRQANQGEFESSALTPSDVSACYQQLINDCLRRMLVASHNVEVEVRPTGRTVGGLPSYAGYVRILRWDPVVCAVLLQNLPVIDGRIRSLARASVLLDRTRFGGLWVRADQEVPGAPQSLAGMPVELVLQSQPAI